MNIPKSQGSHQWQGQDISLWDLTLVWSFPLCHSCLFLAGLVGQRSARLNRVWLCDPCGPKGRSPDKLGSDLHVDGMRARRRHGGDLGRVQDSRVLSQALASCSI